MYGNEALAINQWDGVKNITCDNPVICPMPNGEAVLKNLGFEKVIDFRIFQFWKLL
jgi:hypothetical protein